MTDTYTVIGGGVVGVSAALALARRKCNVTLIEQFDLGHFRGSSHGGSRIIRYLYDKPHYPAFMDNSYKIWDRISKEEEVTLYQDCALVNISEYSKIDDYTKVLSMFNREHQVYSPEDFNGLYGSNLSDNEYTVMEPNAGIMNPYACIKALCNQLVKFGGSIKSRTKVMNIKHSDNEFAIKTDTGEIISSTNVILACGPWTNIMLENFDMPLPLAPIRVDVLYWPLKEGQREKYNIKNFCAGIYDVVEPEDKVHRHLLGGYWCPENEYHNLIKIACHGCFGQSMTPDKRDSACQDARLAAINRTKKLISKVFPDAIDTDKGPAIEETCIYTMTPDGDFILDKHPTIPNLVIAAGFSGHGYKMAPEVGEVLADLSTDKNPKYDMRPFSIARFQK